MKHLLAITLLSMELTDWERIKYNSDKSIQKNGMNEIDCKTHEYSQEKINSLVESIELLKNKSTNLNQPTH